MLEAILAQQLNEEFLGKIGIGCSGAFFYQQAGASRATPKAPVSF